MAPFRPDTWVTPYSNPDDDHGSRTVARAARRGELVRIRRGLYLPPDRWVDLEPWERFRVKIQAVNDAARKPPVFCGQSAAALWDLPLVDVPDEVETLVFPGRGGGRSKNAIRRRTAGIGDTEIARVDGLLVTSEDRTIRDLAIRLPLTGLLPAVDRAALFWQRTGRPPEEFGDGIRSTLGTLSNAKQRRTHRVLAAADPRSGSSGESLSRAVMIQAGLPKPRIQEPHHDSDGLIGYSDFYWPEHGVVGEFDGRAKYSRAEHLAGRTPEDVLEAEKIREDRLRATGLTVVRWMWPAAKDPAELLHKLRNAGIRP
ncbi:MAG TPA: type IV toxin-antitoxin system AbiEi family antitoxin domain-containing protein [Arthrobacter sp.]|nr:type IV toxin-antitoxin system AbiEi family antitoxin domain-containing protein [Arthrobacter sp.]